MVRELGLGMVAIMVREPGLVEVAVVGRCFGARAAGLSPSMAAEFTHLISTSVSSHCSLM